jgi:hypothetical protein
LNNALPWALTERVGIDAVNDADRIVVDLDPFDQCPEDLLPGSPVDLVQAAPDSQGEVLELTDHQLQVCNLLLVLSCRSGLGLQAAQSVPCGIHPRLEGVSFEVAIPVHVH